MSKTVLLVFGMFCFYNCIGQEHDLKDTIYQETCEAITKTYNPNEENIDAFKFLNENINAVYEKHKTELPEGETELTDLFIEITVKLLDDCPKAFSAFDKDWGRQLTKRRALHSEDSIQYRIKRINRELVKRFNDSLVVQRGYDYALLNKPNDAFKDLNLAIDHYADKNETSNNSFILAHGIKAMLFHEMKQYRKAAEEYRIIDNVVKDSGNKGYKLFISYEEIKDKKNN